MNVILTASLLGSDTRINERWFGYDTIFKEYRNWLAQIPLEQVRRIAIGNALRLFDHRHATDALM